MDVPIASAGEIHLPPCPTHPVESTNHGHAESSPACCLAYQSSIPSGSSHAEGSNPNILLVQGLGKIALGQAGRTISGFFATSDQVETSPTHGLTGVSRYFVRKTFGSAQDVWEEITEYEELAQNRVSQIAREPGAIFLTSS